MAGSKPGERRGGRKKGTPNKATADVRAAIAKLAQNRAADVERWLKQTAEGVKRGKEWLVKPDPAKAAQIYLSAIEYHIPKLSRTELSTGSDTLKVEIVDPTRRDRPAAE